MALSLILSRRISVTKVCEVCQKPYSERQTRKRKDGSFWAYRHVHQLGNVTWCHGILRPSREKENVNK